MDTTIETSPKLNIRRGETAALYMMMFNGADLDMWGGMWSAGCTAVGMSQQAKVI